MENGFVLSANAQRIAITNSHTLASLALAKRSRAETRASLGIKKPAPCECGFKIYAR